jgi:predicted transcriptional regulator
MTLIAKLFTALPDKPFMSVHSAYLAPYYSATSAQGLTVRLSKLVDEVVKAPADDENARQVIDNFEEWADEMYQTEKELLLHAIEKRSQFTFDMIHWITSVAKMLIDVSNAAACDENTQQELRKHAASLIAVLSWVPEDEETVKFVENFRMTETLFEAAVNARRRGCPELADDIGNMLLSWTFKVGRYQTGWATLERSVYGLATLALFADDADAETRLKAEINSRMTAGGLPNKELRDRAALKIRRRADSLNRNGHRSSAIERGMAQSDHGKLQPLLEEIADLISPETQGQAANHRF